MNNLAFCIQFLIELDIDDVSFSPESLEAAAINSQKNDSSQAVAVEILNKWSQTPSSLIDALYLLQNSSSFITHFISSSLIKNKIANYWNQMEQNDKKEYINSLSTIILASIDIDSNVLYNLIDALCTIAVFEWPDDYHSFSSFFFPTNDPIAINLSLNIISTFFEKIDQVDIITDLRRNNLRQHIISDFKEPIVSIITNYLTVNELSYCALEILNYMVRWDSNEDIMNYEIFQQMVLQLLPNEMTCGKTMKCFKTIFLVRIDSINAFSEFSPFLIDSLAKFTFPDQKPVTANQSVIQFLIKYLEEYSWILEIILIYDQIKELKDSESLIDDDMENFVKAMQENDISFSSLHDDLIYLYRVILSISSEDIVDDLKISFWNLWQKNLRNIVNEQQIQNAVASSSSFFLPLFNEIINSLFNLLVSFADDKEDNFYQMESILSSIYTINPDDYISFLSDQLPSPQLCFAISTFEFNIDDLKLESVLMIIIDLFQYMNDSQSPDIEFQSAFLFGMSHCSKFFKDNNQLFSQFVDIIFSSISENNELVSKAATRAFKYIVSNSRDLFKDDIQLFIEPIISQSEDFLLNMESESLMRIYKSCTILIDYSNEEESIRSLYAKLFEPILNILNQFDQYQLEIVEKALNIISKCFRDSTLLCSESASFSTELFEFFWIPLFQLATNLIPDVNYSNYTIECLLTAIGTIQLKLQFNLIDSQLSDIFTLMKNREIVEDSFFTYFSIIRATHEEMDSMYQFLNEELIMPYLINEEATSVEMFNMIGKFSPNVVDIGWLTDVVFESIKTLDKNVGENALEVYQSIIKQFDDEQKISFLNSVAPKLIITLIESIVNLIHVTLFRRLITLLRSVLTLIDFESFPDEKVKNLPSYFMNIIVESLKELAIEPQQDFFENFSTYLVVVVKSNFEFFDAFSNLLIVLRKASPCDFELFKV